jgi:hypothetical protein
MAGSVTVDHRAAIEEIPSRTLSSSSSVPWPLACVVAAVTSFCAGLYWDLAWHQSVGHDNFWIPPHILIYSCGVLAGVSCGYLILSTTFRHREAERAVSVKVWGLHAPLGAFMAAWGGIVMLTAAGFDNWWHIAYGLDAKISSPPHWALGFGIAGVQIGGIVLLAGAMNRDSGPVRKKLELLFLYLGATILVLQLIVPNHRILYHSALCYAAVCAITPGVMIGMATASWNRWACTIVGAIYMVFVAANVWILPFFPATPRLGPVYQPVTHYIPLEFPLLLVVPGFLMDCVRVRLPQANRWLLAVILGPVFLAGLVAAQWPFADFMMSPWARNWFFGAHYLPYFTRPTSHLGSNQFFPVETTRMRFWVTMAAAMVAAILSSRIGMACGGWLRKVRR